MTDFTPTKGHNKIFYAFRPENRFRLNSSLKIIQIELLGRNKDWVVREADKQHFSFRTFVDPESLRRGGWRASRREAIEALIDSERVGIESALATIDLCNARLNAANEALAAIESESEVK